MLKSARKELPEPMQSTERFEIPNVRGRLEGNKTLVTNFTQIADTLGRNPNHLLKYVLKEVASPGEFRKQTAIFGSKVPASKINEKIQQYADEFVFCKECGKPDTKMTKDGDIYYIKCQVCGARHSFYAKI